MPFFFHRNSRTWPVRPDTLLATNGTEITAAVKNIESSTEDTEQLMDGLQSGKGLAGTVLQNEQLATNVQIIASNLAITTSNLNRLGLWGILWAHKPPATNAARRTAPQFNSLNHDSTLGHPHFVSGPLHRRPATPSARCGRNSSASATAALFGMVIGFGFGGLLIAMDEMLKGFSLRAFSATTFGLLLGTVGRAAH